MTTHLSGGAVICAVSTLVLACAAIGTGKKPEPGARAGDELLWREPVDIASRDLYYGAGGATHAPVGPFRFVEEDLTGTTPKFNVVGADGTIWMAKLGVEARPETAASRLLWAVGYFADEEYLIPALTVENMPSLRRGGKVVKKDGAVHNVRLRRRGEQQEKVGTWSWEKCPFAGTRQWYGLRVMMAVINNWDLKDVNNSIYQVRGEHPEQHYLVSDLGASFGTTGLNRGAKGNVEEYRRSRWINNVSGEFVDFNVPSSPGIGYLFDVPEMARRRGLLWLGRRIPVTEARWMGSLLARLSTAQIHDAFRAGGYPPEAVEEFSQVLEGRIRELNGL